MVVSLPDGPRLRRIADYQFGRGAGRALFEDVESLTRTRSGRPNQLHDTHGRLVTLGQDGRFTLGFAGGRRLLRALEYPAYRVVVGEESDPFVREGRNVFAKFVEWVDPEVRAGDEVMVVRVLDSDLDDFSAVGQYDAPLDDGRIERLLGVGRASLDAAAMADFRTGMAVAIREGADDQRP